MQISHTLIHFPIPLFNTAQPVSVENTCEIRAPSSNPDMNPEFQMRSSFCTPISRIARRASERASAESSNGKWENVVNYSCHRRQNLNVFRYVLILSLYLGLFSVFLNSIDICSKHLRYVPSTCNLEFSAPGNRTVERKRENKLLKMRK